MYVLYLYCTVTTVKPLLNGPALSGQFPKSRIESLVNPTNKSYIKRTPELM